MLTSVASLRFASLALLALTGAAAVEGAASAQTGASVFAGTPKDAQAITVKAVGDGKADDTAAIQRALDAAAARPGFLGEGIVFLPQGRYRLSGSLYIWPGLRLIGTGGKRPVLFLAPKTAGFAKGIASMVVFSGRGPAPAGVPVTGIAESRRVPFPLADTRPFNPDIADASPNSFYSGLSNIDIEIGEGNPAAVGVRFHAAQHAVLRHMDFRVGSGLAGVYHVANVAQDLRFFGGRYGILAEKPSPAWPFTLLDSQFSGQREAAIREHEAGLTLVNVSIADTPTGIAIDKGYGDWLWGKDVRFARVAKAAVAISNEGNVYTQIGFDNAVASATPVFARFNDSRREVKGAGGNYAVKSFSYGLTLDKPDQPGTYQTRIEQSALAALPKPVSPAIAPLPAMAQWADAHDLGVKGDGVSDDTAALQAAIDTKRVLYLPSGTYRVSAPLRMRADSVLIGLHPDLTQIVLDEDAPAFAGMGAPVGLVESAKGGAGIISGIGLFTGGSNPRATALLWKAGAASLVDDVKMQGGHGTRLRDGTRFAPYNDNSTADRDPKKRWSGQYPSILVTDGGGGSFNGIWTPSTYASAGMMVENTSTPGFVYEISSEHHQRAEVVLSRVANWQFLAPQMEEEAGEGVDALAFDIRDSRAITLANFHAYRVTRTRKAAPMAIRMENSSDIRLRNVHVNAESGLGTCDEGGCATFLRASKFAFENTLVDMREGLSVREREFAVLDWSGKDRPSVPLGKVTKLAGDFQSASGGVVDAQGRILFIDRPAQRILRWGESVGLSTLRDVTFDPVQLMMDSSGQVLALSSLGRQGSVYRFAPDAPLSEIQAIAATPLDQLPKTARLALPANVWANGEFRDRYDPATGEFTTLTEILGQEVGQVPAAAFVSPDGSIALPQFRTFQQGPADHRGYRFSHSLDAYGLFPAKPGQRVAIAASGQNRTWLATVGAGGQLTDLAPFAPRGGESVAMGPDGRVYIANGQVYIYSAKGEELGRIDVPERPLQVLFGGADGRKLYILTHHSLYAAQM